MAVSYRIVNVRLGKGCRIGWHSLSAGTGCKWEGQTITYMYKQPLECTQKYTMCEDITRVWNTTVLLSAAHPPTKVWVFTCDTITSVSSLHLHRKSVFELCDYIRMSDFKCFYCITQC